MKETRVNLRHLLEDIRDSYPFPIDETILVELIANALDARASNQSCSQQVPRYIANRPRHIVE